MYNQIAANKRNSFFLIAGFVLVLLLLGYGIGAYSGDIYSGLLIAAVVSVIMTTIGYFKGHSVALAVSGAKPITRQDNEMLYRLVENLAIAEGLPTPKVYVIADGAPNAFAAGRDPKHAVIAVTTGLLQIMEKVELEGVLAHEIGHIKNFDTRIMTLVVVLVGTIVLVSDIFTRGAIFGRRGNNKGGGALAIIGLVLVILSPIIAQILKLAISRQREYLADATAALTTRYPEGLARALEKIGKFNKPMQKASGATAHLFIASPFSPAGKAKSFGKLFSTHPPIEDRIKRLRKNM